MLPIGYTSAAYSFAGGTMEGHLLKGEERFSVTLDKKDSKVRYKVQSLSKPAHPLATIGYPVVCLLQNCFIRQSTRSLARKIREGED